MIVNKKRPLGFAFIASIGVLLVLLIIVFGVAAVSNYSYHQTSNLEKEVRMDLLIDSGIVKLIAAVKANPSQTQSKFNFKLDDGVIELDCAKLTELDPLYKQIGLAYLAGDSKVEVTAYMPKKEVNALKKTGSYVVNIEGKRVTSIQYK